ncbi:MAG: ABC-F family ATP-binding cassette domain-containing protein [Bacillota bacterium]
MLITIENVDFGYNHQTTLENLNIKVNDGDRIGLIGKNGGGKTTLLRLILGELEATAGKIIKKSQLTIGYLQQNTGLEKDTPVYEEMMSVFKEVTAKVQKQEDLSCAMSAVDHSTLEYRKIVAEYDRIGAEIFARDGYNTEIKVKTVLNGMGFAGKYNQTISTMSGGEKTRLALAKLLLEAPEVLILDEPTNHLDFATLQWLEDYLSTYKGAIIIVSHDRYFLDKMVGYIWELQDKEVERFTGNYSKYKVTKEELVKFRLKEYEKQQQQISSMQEYAEKNIARATTSNSAKSRLHQLANMEVLKPPRTYEKAPKFNFTFDRDSSKEVLTVTEMPLMVSDRQLCGDVTCSVFRKERVAILGANGTGKSTLIKALVKNADFRIKYGAGVRIGYYDQENLNIDFTNTVLEELWSRHSRASQTEMRGILGGLLLGAEDINKKISVLSGGERAKLGFAIVMAEKSNLLILDEPTNHLDLNSREALENALLRYEGTLIFVSHDRYFLNKLATKTLELTEQKLRTYLGNYDEYLLSKKAEEVVRQKEEQEARLEQPTVKKAYRSAKDRSAEVAKKQRISKLEKDIAQLETAIAEKESELYLPEIASNYIKYNEVKAEYDAMQSTLDTYYDEYFKLS